MNKIKKLFERYNNLSKKDKQRFIIFLISALFTAFFLIIFILYYNWDYINILIPVCLSSAGTMICSFWALKKNNY